MGDPADGMFLAGIRVERYAAAFPWRFGVLRWVVSSLTSSLYLAGCSCTPSLPNQNNGDDDTTVDSATIESGDTGPDPICDVPELEDNGSLASANLLPMEQIACGELQEPGDLDYWETEVDVETWLRVAVVSRGLGAIADVHLVVAPEGETAAKREDDEGTTDASLLWPAKPSTYSITVNEQNFNGDDERYEYELVVSTSKAPLEWDRFEVEPNGDFGSAMAVDAGEVIFGNMQGGIDNDWYMLDVPIGKHTLTVTIEAYSYGSAGDFSIWLYDDMQGLLPEGCDHDGCGPAQQNCVDCEVFGPPAGFAHDPILEFESLGGETLYWRVAEFQSEFGDAYWYTMKVELEGS